MLSKNDNQALLTIEDAATILNVSKATIRRWTNTGLLPCSRIGKRGERRFLKVDLMKFVTETTNFKEGEVSVSQHKTVSHCCFVSNTVDEEWVALSREILQHIGEGAQIVLIEGADRKNRLAKLLKAKGLHMQDLLDTHALRCLSVNESYLLSGTFKADRVIAFVESTILEAKARGFERVLFVGYGGWLFKDTKSQDNAILEEVMSYESGLNEMLSRYPNSTVICPYLLNDVSSRMVLDLFCVHPTLQVKSTRVQGLLGELAV